MVALVVILCFECAHRASQSWHHVIGLLDGLDGWMPIQNRDQVVYPVLIIYRHSIPHSYPPKYRIMGKHNSLKHDNLKLTCLYYRLPSKRREQT